MHQPSDFVRYTGLEEVADFNLVYSKLSDPCQFVVGRCISFPAAQKFEKVGGLE
jgi:hypothetical protein